MSRKSKRVKLEYTSNVRPKTRARITSAEIESQQHSQVRETIEPMMKDQQNPETGNGLKLQQSQANQALNNTVNSDLIAPLNSNTQDENVRPEANLLSHSLYEILPDNYGSLLPEISELLMDVSPMVDSQPHGSVEISPTNTLPLREEISEPFIQEDQEVNSQTHNTVEISPANTLPLIEEISESLMHVSQVVNSQHQDSVEISPANTVPLIDDISESVMSISQEDILQSSSSVEMSSSNYGPLLTDTIESVTSLNKPKDSQYNNSVEVSEVKCKPLPPVISDIEMNVCQDANSQSLHPTETAPTNYVQLNVSESVTNIYQPGNSQQNCTDEITSANYVPLQSTVFESVINKSQESNSQSQNEISPANNELLQQKTSASIVNVYQETNSQPCCSIGISSEKSVQRLPQTSELIMNVQHEVNSQSQSLAVSDSVYRTPLSPKTTEFKINECQDTNLQYCGPVEGSSACNGLTLPEISAAILVSQELQKPSPTNRKTPRFINPLAVQESNIKSSPEPILYKESWEQRQFIDVGNKLMATLSALKKTTINGPTRKRLQRKKIILNWRFSLPERLVSWFLSKEQREEILKRQKLTSGQSS